MIRSKPRSCSSTWKLRNNSENVAAVLNPTNIWKEQFIEKMSRNNYCYCSEQPVQPKLCLRPKKCVFLDSDEEEILTVPTTQLKSLKRPVSHSDASSFDEIPVLGLKSNKFLQNYWNNCQNSIDKEEDENDYDTTLLSRKTSTKNNTRCSNNTFSNKNLNYLEQVDWKINNDVEKNKQSNIKELSTFRKDHYFETHSTESLIKPIPEHTCVHKFTLDERFLPQSLNADAYGESRCIICNKPMKSIKLSKTDDRIINKTPELLPKFYKYGLVPKKIFMGNQDNIKIDMILNNLESDYYLSKCTSKRPEYFNTYALRYQKGVE